MPRINQKNKLLYPELSYRLCGFCYQVHNKLGRFRNEKQYADALEEVLKRYLVSANKELGLIVNFRQNYLSPKKVLVSK